MSGFVDRRGIAFAPGAVRPESVVDVAATPPQRVEPDGAPTWIVRAANFVVAITRARAGTRLVREGHPDEYMLFVPPEGLAQVEAGGERLTAASDSLTILPPGDSAVTVPQGGEIFRIFSNRAIDMLALSANADAYADAVAEVAPLAAWPDPAGGYRLRTYPMTNVARSDAFGRIFRSTNLMVNIFDPYDGPRDQAALSPHSHDDFEQGSLTIAGRFEHYLRTPWGKDRGLWRADNVVACGSPSMTVVPAGMVHTTAWLDAGGRMIDIFAPPRADFSRQPGWVRNAADYPAPAGIGGAQ